MYIFHIWPSWNPRPPKPFINMWKQFFGLYCREDSTIAFLLGYIYKIWQLRVKLTFKHYIHKTFESNFAKRIWMNFSWRRQTDKTQFTDIGIFNTSFRKIQSKLLTCSTLRFDCIFSTVARTDRMKQFNSNVKTSKEVIVGHAR